MAEFIFDLQRFDEAPTETVDTTETVDDVGGSGNSDGAGAGEGGDGGGGGGDSGGDGGGVSVNTENAGSNSRDTENKVGTSAWGTYTYDEWNAVADNARDNYATAYNYGTINYLSATTGVADNFLVSRYAINEIYNLEPIDTVTFVDAKLSDFAAYYSGKDTDYNNYTVTGQYQGLLLNIGTTEDSGAGSTTVIHFGADDPFSPTLAFTDYSVLYSDATGWVTTENFAFSLSFWSNCISQSGITGTADIINAVPGVNNYINNVDNSDIVYLYDKSLVNDFGTVTVAGNTVGFTFQDGTSTLVEYSGTFSPTIMFGSGESFVYNSVMDAWRTPAEAEADAWAYAVAATIDSGSGSSGSGSGSGSSGSGSGGSGSGDTYLNGSTGDSFTASKNSNTVMVDGSYADTITFTDAVFADVVGGVTTGLIADNANSQLTVNFNTGTTATIDYWSYFSPQLSFADGNSFGYDYDTETWGVANRLTSATDFVDISGGVNNIIYDAEWTDFIRFTDVDVSQVVSADFDTSYIHINFDNGTTTAIRSDAKGTGWSPHIYFGPTAETGGYFYSSTLGRWINFNYGYTYEQNLFDGGSADLASDGLWGDTFSGTAQADEIFVGTVGNTLVQNVDAQDTITFDAALSDIVATSVADNTIAVAFNTGVTAVIETSGDSPTFNLASGESYIYDRQDASWKTA